MVSSSRLRAIKIVTSEDLYDILAGRIEPSQACPLAQSKYWAMLESRGEEVSADEFSIELGKFGDRR